MTTTKQTKHQWQHDKQTTKHKRQQQNWRRINSHRAPIPTRSTARRAFKRGAEVALSVACVFRRETFYRVLTLFATVVLKNGRKFQTRAQCVEFL